MAISRELGGDDRVVAVVQYLRVGLVTATMPVVTAVAFAARPGAAPQPAGSAPLALDLAFLVCCAVAGGVLARAARLPAGMLLGPMVAAIVANLAGWSGGAAPPELLVEVAYAVIG